MMSGLGQIGKAQCEQMFSALPLREDIARRSRHVCLVPITEVADSFDYLVGLPEQRRRAGKQFYESLASPIA
jgi:hypothetical protein